MMTTRQAILDYARTLLGTPFLHQGRLPGVGLDCIGVVAVTARHFGLTGHDLQGYARRPDGVTLLREFRKALAEVPRAEVLPGDVLTFWDRDPRFIRHAAVATDVGMLHSTAVVRRVVEHVIDQAWAARLGPCFRLPGVSGGFGKPVPWPVMDDPRVKAEAERQAARFLGRGCCGG